MSESGNADANRTLVNNIGRAIVSKLDVKVEGQTIFTLNNADIFLCYQDLRKTTHKKKKMPCIKASRAKQSEKLE